VFATRDCAARLELRDGPAVLRDADRDFDLVLRGCVDPRRLGADGVRLARAAATKLHLRRPF
jgi:hypothetical protein